VSEKLLLHGFSRILLQYFAPAKIARGLSIKHIFSTLWAERSFAKQMSYYVFFYIFWYETVNKINKRKASNKPTLVAIPKWNKINKRKASNKPTLVAIPKWNYLEVCILFDTFSLVYIIIISE
jgi:uncharacterized protein with von Willebrand factor type A (vWA) domain